MPTGPKPPAYGGEDSAAQTNPFNPPFCYILSGFLGFHREFGLPAQNMRASEFMGVGCTFADVADVAFPALPTCPTAHNDCSVGKQHLINGKFYGYLDHLCFTAPLLYNLEGSTEGVQAAAFAHARGMEVDGALEADRAAVREIFKEWHDEFLQDLVSADVRGGGGAAQAKSNCVRIKKRS